MSLSTHKQPKHLLLFTGDNTVNLEDYSDTLGDNYYLRSCGCLTLGRMVLREARGHKLDLVVIMWEHIDLKTASDIAKAVRSEFPDMPIVVIAHPRVHESEIKKIDPKDEMHVIRLSKGKDHIRLFASIVPNLVGDHEDHCHRDSHAHETTEVQLATA
ncbi:MAG: hypothetical protein V4524_03130 [Patescibacteria group bacterium]